MIPGIAHVLQIPFLELASQRGRLCSQLRRPLNDLIVYIGEILKVKYAETPVLEIACHHIEGDVSPGMADVRIVVNGRSADK
jgi:hypothetical protein